MAEVKGWPKTVYVCPDCGDAEWLCTEPKAVAGCSCPDRPEEPNFDYPDIDKPIMVVPDDSAELWDLLALIDSTLVDEAQRRLHSLLLSREEVGR